MSKKTVKAISEEFSLREPQYLALLKLDSVLASIELGKDSTQEIEAQVAGNLKFDTEFPSFCFSLATGVGKTKLMGAMISYLLREGISKNFFILTKGETVYKKTIDNFTKGHPKYVMDGDNVFPEFQLIHGDNYTRANYGGQLLDPAEVNIFVFNIEKVYVEQRGEGQFKFHEFQETLGSSFAELLQNKSDLVMLMDESHRYRGPASLKAINNLNPIVGLEFTATPESKNVLYEYNLGQAIQDSKIASEGIRNGGTPLKPGYIKIPYIVARREDDSYKGDLEAIKLEDGIDRHRRKKALIEEYCANNNVPLFVPVTLITTQSKAHAKEVFDKITADTFFEGYYKGRTLRIDSDSEAEDIRQLLHLEQPVPINQNEIVIHVEKLKEGWDVRNVYTIIPFRASISKKLIEQTIGRGLRLPFGELTGEDELDSLEVISHENFQKVLDAAHQVAAALEVKQGRSRQELEVITVAPDPAKKKFGFDIPLIDSKVLTSSKFKPFKPKVGVDDFRKLDPKLIKADIADKKKQTVIGKVKSKAALEPDVLLTRILIQDVSELDMSDKAAVLKVVRDYLAQVPAKGDALNKLVQTHTGKIVNDLTLQFKEAFDEDTKVTHSVKPETMRFKAFTKALPKGTGATDRGAVIEDQIKTSLLGDYAKSEFTQSTFDTRQEKIMADVLEDNSPDVIRWARIPVKQMPIKYIHGNYNPDFLVETKDATYVIEVKEQAKIDDKDKDVLAKAREAKKWCDVVSKTSKKPWVYKLISHSVIKAEDSFQAILSQAVNFD